MTEEVSVEAPAATPAQEAAPWYASIEDAETRGWVENKGYKDPTALVKQTRELERLIGARESILQIPKDDAEQAEWDAFYSRLGRPDDPAGYGLSELEGADADFATNVQQWMHESGIPKTAAQKLAQKWQEYGAKVMADQEAAETLKNQTELEGLKKEWGQNFPELSERAKRAAATFMGADQMVALEAAVGTGNMLKMFAKIGEAISEDKFVGADSVGQNGFTMTPEGAKAKISELIADEKWKSAYLNGDEAKLQQMQRLQKLAAGMRG